jgi:DNA-directed RNA polymerase specialized sigma24 family protein
MAVVVTDEAFREAWENQEYRKLMNKLSRPFRGRLDPDDITSAQLQATWDSLRRPCGRRKFQSTLGTYCRWRLLKNLHRNRRNLVATTPDLNWVEDLPAQLPLELPGLSSELYKVLRCRYEGHTYKEIARLLQCSISTARTRVMEALEYVRCTLQ